MRFAHTSVSIEWAAPDPTCDATRSKGVLIKHRPRAASFRSTTTLQGFIQESHTMIHESEPSICTVTNLTRLHRTQFLFYVAFHL